MDSCLQDHLREDLPVEVVPGVATADGVLAPGGKLMEIVPLDDQLRVVGSRVDPDRDVVLAVVAV